MNTRRPPQPCDHGRTPDTCGYCPVTQPLDEAAYQLHGWARTDAKYQPYVDALRHIKQALADQIIQDRTGGLTHTGRRTTT